MKTIQLTQGKVALVDDQDFEMVNVHGWYAHRKRNTFYAERMVRHQDGRRMLERVHRKVLERQLGRALADDDDVDHINGDGLDNRRGNLRLATRSQNLRNRHRRAANPSSRYLGVSLFKRTARWCARIRVNGKRLHLGYYDTALAAAQAREAYITARPELMARSNFNN